MLVEYIDTGSFLHRLDVRTKLMWFVAVIVAAFLLEDPLAVLQPVLFSLLLMVLAKLPIHPVKRLLGFLLPVLVIVFVMTSFSHVPEQFHSASSRRILFYLFPNETAPLTVGGMLLGLTFLWRIIVMVLSSLILTYTTPVDDLLLLFQKLRFPYTASFVVASAIRFIPTMENKARMVMDAQRSRGSDLDSGHLVQRIKKYTSVMVPMIVDSIRMSENVALAMLNRGFGSSAKRTMLRDIELRARDYFLILLALGVIVLSIVLRSKGIGTL